MVAAPKLEQECRVRERFVQERLSRPASHDELKDLTEFFHQARADILRCNGCSLLWRRELTARAADTYSEEEYNPSVMERQYPRYLDAFRGKEKPYRGLLSSRARVLEIGSHYGAFLETAQQWGWRAEGVDVGKDTVRFARAKGFTVHDCDLVDCKFESETFEGIFIWNCFEQIVDPKPVLAECRRILCRDGLLVVRTPNGLFYTLCERLLAHEELRSGAAEFLIHAMGYNNLLGFPYLYGHSQDTLERLIQPFGFVRNGTANSELLALPLPENPKWVEEEERIISDEIRMLTGSVLAEPAGPLAGPWIEMWFRRSA